LFGQQFDLGVFGSAGVTGGLNVSGDVFVGYVTEGIGNVSGTTFNQNLGVGPISITTFRNPNSGELIGGTIGLGPSATTIGTSVAVDITGTRTVRDFAKWLNSLIKPKFNTNSNSCPTK
jgi:hypothetical protein